MVTEFTTQNVYVYAAKKLWIAYGLAALLTTGSVIIGILTIFANGASYSNEFSTVLRIARAAELSIEIQESDLGGENPLPSYLAKATVMISGRKDHQGWTSDAQKNPIDSKTTTVETSLLS